MQFTLGRALALGMLPCLLSLVNATPLDLPSYKTELEARQQTAPENCASGIHMIVGPGKGAAKKNGLLQTLINKVKQNVAGSNARTIHYDGTEHPIDEARPRFTRYVKTYAATCPNTPIFIVGYSTGGILGMDVLCGASENIGTPTQPISPSYTNNVIAFTSYGEETWRANQSYDAPTDRVCKKDAPTFPRQNPGGCSAFASVIRSYCDEADGECCAGAIGGPAAHLAYPMEYDTDALNFVMSQYNSYRLRHPLGGPGLPIPQVPGVNLATLATTTGFY